MRFEDAVGHDVMSTSTAVAVGRVKSFIVDPATSRVAALVLKKTPAKATLLLWSDLTAFGPDAVTVAGPDQLRESSPEVEHLVGKDHALKRKRVLTEAGFDLGTVGDVEFDPADGRITALLVGDQSVAGSRLMGVGSYAVIVAAEATSGSTD